MAAARIKRKSSAPKSGCLFCGKPHPVWWNNRLKAWFLTVPDASRKNGQRQERLAKGWDGHDQAIQEWHKIEAGQHRPQHTHGEDMRVVDLANMLLENLKPKLSAKRFRNTERYLDDLCGVLGKATIAQMRRGGIAKVENWIASHSGWNSPSTRRAVVSRVKQIFKWGVDQGLIASSPIQSLKRETDNVRIALFSEKQVDAILKNSPPAFAQAFNVLLLTGMRPDEFCRFTADDLRDDGGLHGMIDHKNQKTNMFKGEKRRIYLLFKHLKAIFIQAKTANPHGPLFRTSHGNGWSVGVLPQI